MVCSKWAFNANVVLVIVVKKKFVDQTAKTCLFEAYKYLQCFVIFTSIFLSNTSIYQHQKAKIWKAVNRTRVIIPIPFGCCAPILQVPAILQKLAKSKSNLPLCHQKMSQVEWEVFHFVTLHPEDSIGSYLQLVFACVLVVAFLPW